MMKLYRSHAVLYATLCLTLTYTPALDAQVCFDTTSKAASNPLTNPAVSPGTAFLYQLEAKFAKDTTAGGGKAFASWFADDAVSLSNGKAAVSGRAAIAANADWSPAQYQLTWTPQGGQIRPVR